MGIGGGRSRQKEFDKLSMSLQGIHGRNSFEEGDHSQAPTTEQERPAVYTVNFGKSPAFC
jgi:hypothetical protein